MVHRTALLLLSAALCSAIDLPKEAAPRFRAKTVEGVLHTKESLKGKVVMIQFWTTWCGYCRAEQPLIDQLVKQHEGHLVVLAVNSGEPGGTVRKYLSEHPRECDVVMSWDTDLRSAFPGDGFPRYVTLDREGNIAARQNGAGGMQPLRDMLRKAGLR